MFCEKMIEMKSLKDVFITIYFTTLSIDNSLTFQK